jgi:hypothetical protein
MLRCTPWSTNTHPTDVAKSHVEEITAPMGATHKYTVFQSGTMDGRNCRSPMGCGISREGANAGPLSERIVEIRLEIRSETP